MCNRKPGNRCSNHAGKAVVKAQAAFDANPTEKTFEALKTAQKDFDTTPAGQKALAASAASATSPDERQAFLDRAAKGKTLHEQRAEAYERAEHAGSDGEVFCGEISEANGWAISDYRSNTLTVLSPDGALEEYEYKYVCANHPEHGERYYTVLDGGSEYFSEADGEMQEGFIKAGYSIMDNQDIADYEAEHEAEEDENRHGAPLNQHSV